MAIDTKPNFNSGKFEQCSGDIMNLSGCTQIYGVFDIESSATLTICENAGDGKILTSNANGVATWQVGGITAISGGSGMNFSPITTTGEIILGTPSAILNTSIDVSSGTTHIHAFSASTFVTGTQGILVDGNNRFYLDDVYVTDSILPDLYSFSGITANQNLGSLPTGQTLGMVYITNTGTTAATVNLGTTALGNDITPFQPIDIDAGEDVSITVNMRLSLTESKTIFINSDDWTNVGLNVQWANVTFKNVPLPTGGTGGLTSSSNGLNDDGTTVKLGGTLTENTCINGNAGNYGLTFSGATHFCVDAQTGGGTDGIYLTADSSKIYLQGCNVSATFADGNLDIHDSIGNNQIELGTDGDVRFCNLTAKTTETDVIYINSSTGRLASGATGGGTGTTVGTLQQVTDCGNITNNSINIGVGNTVTGNYSLVQGCSNVVTGNTAHAEGWYNYAYGCASHAEGESSYACGYASHAEGIQGYAFGCGSHTEGSGSCALGDFSHSEGDVTCAVGCGAHAEGFSAFAIGDSSHAEGNSTRACGIGAHAEGLDTHAVRHYSHAEGKCTITSGTTMLHADGCYNSSKDGNIYEIGVGSSTVLRCNAFEVSNSGDIALPEITGCTSSNVLYYDNTSGLVSYGAAGGGASPGGSDGAMQYNNGGSFGGTSLNWDDSLNHIGWGTGATATSMLRIKSDTAYDTCNTILEVIDVDSASLFKLNSCAYNIGSELFVTSICGYVYGSESTLKLNCSTTAQVDIGNLRIMCNSIWRISGGDAMILGSGTDRVCINNQLKMGKYNALSALPFGFSGESIVSICNHSTCPDGLYFNNYNNDWVQLDAAEIQFAVSDETTDLTTGTAKLTFRMPYAMTLSEVRASVGTAPTGANLIVDINENTSTILSTKLSIDAGEKTSTTAATPAVISDTTLADDAEITIDIDQIGSTVAGAGLKVLLKGVRA